MSLLIETYISKVIFVEQPFSLLARNMKICPDVVDLNIVCKEIWKRSQLLTKEMTKHENTSENNRRVFNEANEEVTLYRPIKVCVIICDSAFRVFRSIRAQIKKPNSSFACYIANWFDKFEFLKTKLRSKDVTHTNTHTHIHKHNRKKTARNV